MEVYDWKQVKIYLDTSQELTSGMLVKRGWGAGWAVGGEQGACFVAFADFRHVNTPTIADFELRTV